MNSTRSFLLDYKWKTIALNKVEPECDDRYQLDLIFAPSSCLLPGPAGHPERGAREHGASQHAKGVGSTHLP